MSLKYIRDTYHVPAFRGRHIIYGASDGEELEAVITGSRNSHLLARYIENDGKRGKRVIILHPTWQITYL